MGALKELYVQACENVLCGAVPSNPGEEAAVVAEAYRLAAESPYWRGGGKKYGEPVPFKRFVSCKSIVAKVLAFAEQDEGLLGS